MKLSEYENEDALELVGDILEPLAEILGDEEIAKAFKTMPTIKIASLCLKKHAKNVVEILARIEGVPVEKYKGNIVTMTKSILDILNDEAFSDFFPSLPTKTE